jgi:hypothetical protein
MLYDIKLVIDYAFETPAAGARQILRAMPLNIDGRQRLIAGHVSIDAGAVTRLDRKDFFGNQVTEMAFAEAHRDIVISLAARVEVTGGAAPGGLSCDLAGLRQVLSEIRDLGPRSPLHFLAPAATPRPIRISASGPRALARTVFQSVTLSQISVGPFTTKCASTPRPPRWTRPLPRPSPPGTAFVRTSPTS